MWHSLSFRFSSRHFNSNALFLYQQTHSLTFVRVRSICHIHHMLCSVRPIQHMSNSSIWIPFNSLLFYSIHFLAPFFCHLSFFLSLNSCSISGILQEEKKNARFYSWRKQLHTHKKDLVKHSIEWMTIKLEYRSSIDNIMAARKTNDRTSSL